MKTTLRVTTDALMKPLGEMLFGNGRAQGQLMGAQQAQALASADYNQARAMGQQQRNRWQSDEGLGEIARIMGGDYSKFNLDGLDEGGRKKAQDTLAGILQSYAMTGDTNFQQYAKGRQDMAVHDAAVYENNPLKAGLRAAAFDGGKFWGNAGNGQTFNHLTGQMQGSPLTDSLTYRNRASGDLDYTRADQIKQDMTLVGLDGRPVGGGRLPQGALENIDQVLGVEGGYVADDAGKGETNLGINVSANPDLRGKIRGLTKELAIPIYKTRYWDAIGGDQLPPDLAAVAFDSAVNQGPGKARELLAKSGGDPMRLIQLRKDHYDSLVRADPKKYKKHYNGWMNRLNTLSGMIGGGGGGIPMKYAGPAMARSTYGNKGEKFVAIDPKHPIFQRQIGTDFNSGKPITEFDRGQFDRFNRWAQAYGINNQQQAIQQWISRGRPDAPKQGALDPFSLGEQALRVASSERGKPVNKPSSKPDYIQIAEEAVAAAKRTGTNPGAVVRSAMQKGKKIPPEVIAELKRRGFDV